jgi:hypothetical protein
MSIRNSFEYGLAIQHGMPDAFVILFRQRLKDFKLFDRAEQQYRGDEGPDNEDEYGAGGFIR